MGEVSLDALEVAQRAEEKADIALRTATADLSAMAANAAEKVRDVLLETIQKMDEQLQLDMLLQKLYEYPELIRHQQDAVAAARAKVDGAKAEVDLQTALLQAAIAEEKDGGKARFSNDTMRRAELARRQATHPQYKASEQALAEASTVLESAQFDLERLNNEFVAVRTAAQLQSRRLALIGRLD